MTTLRCVTRIIGLAVIGLAMAARGSLTFAVAHEGHQMNCDKTSVQAMKADIQVMNDGEAKTTAMREMKLAEDTLAKKDIKTCEMHMSKAMEEMEK